MRSPRFSQEEINEARAVCNEALALMSSRIDPRVNRGVEKLLLSLGLMHAAVVTTSYAGSRKAQHEAVEGHTKAVKAIIDDPRNLPNA